MADDRKVLRGVRVGRKLITDVDELAKELSPDQLSALQEKGYLEGNWGGKKESAKEATKGKK